MIYHLSVAGDLSLWKFPVLDCAEAEPKYDYYFELFPDGKATACVYGDTYETAYSVTEGCISFANMELAAMKLSLRDGKLCMRDYLGATITFVRNEKK